MNDHGCEELINAIVLQAFKDYRWATRKLRRHPGNLTAIRMLEDIETFLRSDWLTFLTGLDPDWLRERMDEWAQ